MRAARAARSGDTHVNERAQLPNPHHVGGLGGEGLLARKHKVLHGRGRQAARERLRGARGRRRVWRAGAHHGQLFVQRKEAVDLLEAVVRVENHVLSLV